MKFEYFWQYSELEDLARFREKIRVYIDNFFLVSITNLDKSEGYSLDLIGKIIGFDSRPAISTYDGFKWSVSKWGIDSWGSTNDSVIYIKDDLFKKILKVRTKQLYEKRTIDNIMAYIEYVFPDMVFNYENNINNVIINYDATNLTDEEKAVISSDFILVKQGCKLTFKEI